MTRDTAVRYIPEILERIVRFHPAKVYLFGSAANEKAAEVNDIDLLVVFDPPRQKRSQAVEILSSLRDLPVPVDVVVTSAEGLRANATKKYSIESQASANGKLIYGHE